MHCALLVSTNGNLANFAGLCGERCLAYKSPFVWSESGVLDELLMLAVNTGVWLAVLTVLERQQVQRLVQKLLDRARHALLRRPYEPQQDAHYESALDNIRTLVRRANSSTLDADVHAEQEHVRQAVQRLRCNGKPSPDEMLLVQGLSKQFAQHTAVDSLSFSVHQQECFGLLGAFHCILLNLGV